VKRNTQTHTALPDSNDTGGMEKDWKVTESGFTRQNAAIAGIAFLLLVCALFLNLGAQPIYLEESRRTLISLEMLFNKNLIVPTEFGEFYYKKPPLWNWAIIAAYKVFGNYSEFASRFFTPVSLLLMGAVVFFAGNRYVGFPFGIYSSLLFLIAGDLLFYFSLLAEIDLFYSFITFGSFIAMFHFYQTKRYHLLFLSTYLLSALGTLTKGFPSIAFLGISLTVFFLYNKDWRRLFTLSHLWGIAVYSIIVIGYFYAYSQYNNVQDFLGRLWLESSERTLMGKNALSLPTHIFLYPLQTLVSILPASLLILFAWQKNLLTEIRRNKYIEFCFFILAGNVIVYYLSPGTKQRYTYMLYPLIIGILTYFYLRFSNSQLRRLKALHVIFCIALILQIVMYISLPFIPRLKAVPHIAVISAISGLFGVTLLVVFMKKRDIRLFVIILSVILMRLVFDFTVLHIRATDSRQEADKEQAKRITAIVKNEPLHLYKDSSCSRTTVYYIVRERKTVISRSYAKNSGDFFLTEEKYVNDEPLKIFYQFTDKSNRRFMLIKFI
jgi:4-amino-4-deoxy-L-arabinose transferase-like glycosyltransferase